MELKQVRHLSILLLVAIVFSVKANAISTVTVGNTTNAPGDETTDPVTSWTMTTASPSCDGRCGEEHNSTNACHCDDKCSQFNNCCGDYVSVCGTVVDLLSCEDRCGEGYISSNPCQCNDLCEQYGNCCEDYAQTCGAVVDLLSCEDRCDEGYISSNPCQCNDQCEQYGNCCDDYAQACVAGPDEQYLCKGECNVTRGRCSCMDTCVENKNCCSDYLESCKNEPAWVDEECASSGEMNCPEGFDVPPVLLFSIDGFKAEYIYRNLTPNIWKLASCGVHAPYMRSVYPTKTFPNHYTIATGLYPESHGIIDNTIFDHEMQEEFRLGSPESFNPLWWGGEPIWVTTSNQGKKSACYFWPGSDVNITRYPDYYYKYDGSVDNEERMYQAFDWLDMPKESRPSFITLYMDIVDHEGHNTGPDSEEVDQTLREADRIISILMNGLKIRGLENCVNIIMLADHGMAPISCDRKSSLEDYGVDMDVVYARTGAFGRVGKSKDSSEWDQFNAEETHEMLRCTHNSSHWQSFLKYQYMPKRYHYAYNDRIEPVLLTMDDEWIVEGRKNSNNNCNGGTHGFDNEYKSMHALFASHGPGFKRAYNTTTPFENIEVYNLMADLLELDPAPNNGTSGSLNHVMTGPNTVPASPIQSAADACDDFDESNLDESCAACQAISDENANKRLQLSSTEASDIQLTHMPYGSLDVAPRLNDDVSYCVMTQHDYVTAFDKNRKLPYYASFTLSSVKRDLKSPNGCIRPDPRLPMMTLSCTEYDSDSAIQPVSLYPAELSNGDAIYDATILSNEVPMYEPAAKVWKYMGKELSKWADAYNGVNVVAGPAYDYDYDGIADSHDVLTSKATFLNDNVTSTPIPTHYFLVMTRCADGVTDVLKCASSPNDVAVLSYIIPNYATEPCHEEGQSESQWIPGTALEHVARIRDVELITGISFMTSFTHEEATSQEDRVSAIRVKLRLPQFSSQWSSTRSGGKSTAFQRPGFVVTMVAILSTLLLTSS